MKFLKAVKKLICEYKGHDFEVYQYTYDSIWNDIEMAGRCKRCGYDTHEEEL